MGCTTMPLKFTIELYSKTTEYNAAGQLVSDWSLEKTLPCDFMPSRAEERLVGRLQNPISYNIWVHNDNSIDVSKQLRNLKDANGNVIESGPFNIVGIRKHRGWNTVSHVTINAQKILE